MGRSDGRRKRVGQVKAAPGDHVVVEGNHVSAHRRQGEIVEVHDPDGAPPYLVHWSDTDSESLFFPGPDAHIVRAG
ncbi:DUF1918 domain-containing protein [Kribbella sp. NPDC051952]|uniref:DUF1918 domain-containing protein n=1 Tax=Kribbella sp. NPDC051952 TaxID=3154851 RepID=UPI00342A7917